jgi:MFS family permease
MRPRGHILIAAALGAALNPLNSTMIAVALPAMRADFSADPSTVTLLVVTGYLIATLVCQMPAGSVADRIGHGRALSWGRWIFAAGAAAGAFAPTLSAVVAGRLLMAAGGSLMVPTSMALVRVGVAAERRARAFGTLGAVMGVAAAIGPALGSWLTPLLGWRWLFAINLPVIAVSWALQPPLADSDGQPGAARVRFDWWGSALTAVTLVAFTMATRAHGQDMVVALSVGGAALAALLFIENRVPAPVIDLELFGKGPFVAAAGVIGFQNLAMYSLLVLIPFLFGASAGSSVGLAIMAMTGAMALTSPFGGRLADRVGARLVIVAGGLIGAAGVVAIERLGSAPQPFDLGLRLLLVGLALGLSTGPAQAAGLTAVAAEKSALGSATMSMVRYVGSIAGTVILGFALAVGTDSAARRDVAMWIFAGAFLASAVLGGFLSSTRKGAAPVNAAMIERSA